MNVTITIEDLIGKIVTVKSFLDTPATEKEYGSALAAIRFLVGAEMYEKAMSAINTK